MAAGGWYPDPAESPGRFRYWDGDTWSAQTTANPKNTPPPSSDDDQAGGRRSGRGWIVALVVLALVTTLVAGWLATIGGVPSAGEHAPEDTNSSAPRVSAWDETSTPSHTPPRSPDDGGEWVDCPWSTGTGDTPQQAGRMTAAGLSAAIPPGYELGYHFDMAYDFHGAHRSPDGAAINSVIGVGLISHADGFTQLNTTANQVMQCRVTEGHSTHTGSAVLNAGEQINISGHAAWHVQWRVDYTDEEVDGEILDVIVVDMGHQADYFGVYVSCWPIGFPDFEASIASAMSSLRVT